MLYLVKSPLYGNRKYIYKVGYSNESNIQDRLNSYFYYNPGIEVVSVRQGDEMTEKMIHLYLYSLGYQYKKDGKLNEWFIGNNEVRDIFHISIDYLEKVLWKNRDLIFRNFPLRSVYKDSKMYKIYEYLNGKYGSSKLSEFDKKYKNFIDGEKMINYTGYGEVLTKEDEISKNFLDNNFYSTKFFKERLKLYCEFMDEYKDNKKVISLVNDRIPDEKFKTYYEFYGTSGCKAKKYLDKLLKRGIEDSAKEKDAIKDILNSFCIGKIYSNKEIKEAIQKIYDSYEMEKTAKATELKTYFELERTRVNGVECLRVSSMKEEFVKKYFKTNNKIFDIFQKYFIVGIGYEKYEILQTLRGIYKRFNIKKIEDINDLLDCFDIKIIRSKDGTVRYFIKDLKRTQE